MSRCCTAVTGALDNGMWAQLVHAWAVSQCCAIARNHAAWRPGQVSPHLLIALFQGCHVWRFRDALCGTAIHFSVLRECVFYLDQGDGSRYAQALEDLLADRIRLGKFYFPRSSVISASMSSDVKKFVAFLRDTPRPVTHDHTAPSSAYHHLNSPKPSVERKVTTADIDYEETNRLLSKYKEDHRLRHVLVDSSDERLDAALEKVQWQLREVESMSITAYIGEAAPLSHLHDLVRASLLCNLVFTSALKQLRQVHSLQMNRTASCRLTTAARSCKKSKVGWDILISS